MSHKEAKAGVSAVVRWPRRACPTSSWPYTDALEFLVDMFARSIVISSGFPQS